MKLHSTLLIVALSVAKLSFAGVDTLQFKKAKRISVSFSFGPSVPFGEIASYLPYTNNISGSAKTGLGGRVGINYLVSDDARFTLNYVSSISQAAVPDSKDLIYTCTTCGLGGGSRTTSYNYDTKSWYFNSILVGVLAALDNDPTTVYFKAMVGYMQVKSPKTQLFENRYAWRLDQPVVDTYSSVQTQPQLNGYSFCSDVGIDFSAQISKKLSVALSFDFLFSNVSFNGRTSYAKDYDPPCSFCGLNSTHYQEDYPISFQKNIFLLLANMGMAYKIK